MLRPYILRDRISEPQCAPGRFRPASHYSSPRAAAASRGQRVPPQQIRSPSASATASLPSRRFRARAPWGRRCVSRTRLAQGSGRPTASRREVGGGARARARRMWAVGPLSVLRDAPPQPLRDALRRSLGGGARGHPHPPPDGRPVQAERRDARYGSRRGGAELSVQRRAGVSGAPGGDAGGDLAGPAGAGAHLRLARRAGPVPRPPRRAGGGPARGGAPVRRAPRRPPGPPRGRPPPPRAGPLREGARGRGPGEHAPAAPAHDRPGLAEDGPALRVGPLRNGGLARHLRGAPREALAPDRTQPRGMEEPMRGFLYRLVITALGLWAAATIVPGVTIVGVGTLLLAALLLGIVNAIIRPIILILTLPLTVLTLGLFILVVNGISLALVAWVLPGFTVAGLVPAVLGSIVVGLTGWFASTFIGGSGRIEHIRRIEVTGRRLD